MNTFMLLKNVRKKKKKKKPYIFFGCLLEHASKLT